MKPRRCTFIIHVCLFLLCNGTFVLASDSSKNSEKSLVHGAIAGAAGTTAAGVAIGPAMYAQNRFIQNLSIAKNPIEWMRGTPIRVMGKIAITVPQVVASDANAQRSWDKQQRSTLQKVGDSTAGGTASAIPSNVSRLLGLQQQNHGGSMWRAFNKLPNKACLARGLPLYRQ